MFIEISLTHCANSRSPELQCSGVFEHHPGLPKPGAMLHCKAKSFFAHAHPFEFAQDEKLVNIITFKIMRIASQQTETRQFLSVINQKRPVVFTLPVWVQQRRVIAILPVTPARPFAIFSEIVNVIMKKVFDNMPMLRR